MHRGGVIRTITIFSNTATPIGECQFLTYTAGAEMCFSFSKKKKIRPFGISIFGNKYSSKYWFSKIQVVFTLYLIKCT